MTEPERSMDPERTGVVERGVRVSGADACYLCDAIICDGDEVVFYVDTTFWGRGVLYHRTCWDGADMAAKHDEGEGHGGGALVLAELPCAKCGEMFEIGDKVLRVRGVTPRVENPGPSLPPRVFHAECLPEDRA